MKRKQWLYLSGLGLISLFFFILVISNSAHSASKPDWIEGKSRKYPPEQYLTGVGYGDDRKAAEDSAFAAIARIFQAEIHSKTSELEKYTQTDVKGKTHSSRDIQIDQITSVATNNLRTALMHLLSWTDDMQWFP